MRSRLAEGGALAMRLSLVSFNAARRGAGFLLLLKRRSKISLPSSNRSVDRRKSPSWHARIDSPGPAPAHSRKTRSVQPQFGDVPRIGLKLITLHTLDDVRQHGIGAAG